MKCFERKEVKGRKDYVCELTARIIPQGEVHVASKCVDDKGKLFTHRACMDAIKAYSLVKFKKADTEEKEAMREGDFVWPVSLGEYDSLIYSYIQEHDLFTTEVHFKDRTELVLRDYEYRIDQKLKKLEPARTFNAIVDTPLHYHGTPIYHNVGEPIEIKPEETKPVTENKYRHYKRMIYTVLIVAALMYLAVVIPAVREFLAGLFN